MSARRAERLGKKCHKCANQDTNSKPRRLGFSEAELHTIKIAAANRGKSWNLSIADIHDLWEKQDGRCALTGAQMRKAPRTWSIDRIDNSCGYTPDNIQLVLKQVNMMRGSLSVEDFTELCRAVAAYRSKK